MKLNAMAYYAISASCKEEQEILNKKPQTSKKSLFMTRPSLNFWVKNIILQKIIK